MDFGLATETNGAIASNSASTSADKPSRTTTQTPIRELGIDFNHWYAVARSSELTDSPLSIELWHQAIVLYRDSGKQVRALEDRCPHRHVKLHHGSVVGDNLQCAYHGWCFDGAGQCSQVPYLEAKQKLPTCTIRSYPVQERDGFIWVFPGDRELSDRVEPMHLPEWDGLNFIASVAEIDCEAHFSFLIENLMDMYHGHLHDDYQAWADPVLETLVADGDRVDARYQAQSYYRIDKIWSVSQLFFPQLRKLHPEILDVSYVYPNWTSTLGKDFKICCLFTPVSETHTRAFLIHFTSLHAFHRLHKLPIPFRRWVKNRLFNAAKGLLDGLVEQDVVMVEEEQQAYLVRPERRPYELNRAIASVQNLIRQQAER
ncbi:MAG: aromatic ring-hydroxylating dioxygenase subunit alpha [Cyanobacteria bacterium J06648_11]